MLIIEALCIDGANLNYIQLFFLSKCIDKCCFNWSINFCILSIRHICLTLKWLPKSWANTLSSVFWQEFPLSSAADRYVSSSIGELFILHPRAMFVEETWTRYCKDLYWLSESKCIIATKISFWQIWSWQISLICETEWAKAEEAQNRPYITT